MPSKSKLPKDSNHQNKNDLDALPEDFQPGAGETDIWSVLEDRKRRGTWDGEIDYIPIKEQQLTKGTHYYEITNQRKREVTCTLCPITHGGILEAHLLTRYEVKAGIIYFDKLPRTRAPEKKRIDKRNRKKLE